MGEGRLRPKDPPHDRQSKELMEARSRLIGLGRGWKRRFAWHREKECFWKLVAEILLTKTTRKAAERAFVRLKSLYRNPAEVARADPKEIETLVSSLGLKKRALGISEAAKLFARNPNPPLEDVARLPFVGRYVEEAYGLYCLSKAVFPLDRGVGRVLKRLLLGERPAEEPKTRKEERDPYRNHSLADISQALVEGLDAEVIKEIHQGALYVSWNLCRKNPLCSSCPLSDICKYNKEHHDLNHHPRKAPAPKGRRAKRKA